LRRIELSLDEAIKLKKLGVDAPFVHRATTAARGQALSVRDVIRLKKKGSVSQ
jgi:hypothetical protein